MDAGGSGGEDANMGGGNGGQVKVYGVRRWWECGGRCWEIARGDTQRRLRKSTDRRDWGGSCDGGWDSLASHDMTYIIDTPSPWSCQYGMDVRTGPIELDALYIPILYLSILYLRSMREGAS